MDERESHAIALMKLAGAIHARKTSEASNWLNWLRKRGWYIELPWKGGDTDED